MKLLKVFAALTIIIISILVIPNWHADKSVEDLTEMFGQNPSKWIEAGGMNIHYRDEGEGPILLLLHGTAANLHTWSGWTENLKANYRIIRLDLPGFGLTGPFPHTEYSPDKYSALLNNFVNALNIDKFSIAGNSLGGGIAWNYAFHYPEKIESLILVDPSGFVSKEDVTLAFKMAKTPVINKLMNRITPKSLVKKSLFEVYHNPELVTDSIVDLYFNSMLRKGNRAAFSNRVKTKYVDQTNELRNIKCPVLIQWGIHDTWIPIEHADLFQHKLPQSKLIKYDNAGHIPHEEIPVQTAYDVKLFLESYLAVKMDTTLH